MFKNPTYALQFLSFVLQVFMLTTCFPLALTANFQYAYNTVRFIVFAIFVVRTYQTVRT